MAENHKIRISQNNNMSQQAVQNKMRNKLNTTSR